MTQHFFCHSCQTDQTHQEAYGQRGEVMYQDPADAQRDAGQEGMLSGVCEYLTLHCECVTETWFSFSYVSLLEVKIQDSTRRLL